MIHFVQSWGKHCLSPGRMGKPILFYFFGLATQLAGSQFLDQGLNPCHGSESLVLLITGPPENSHTTSSFNCFCMSKFFLFFKIGLRYHIYTTFPNPFGSRNKHSFFWEHLTCTSLTAHLRWQYKNWGGCLKWIKSLMRNSTSLLKHRIGTSP